MSQYIFVMIMNNSLTFILSMLASIRSCWTVLLAWAILLELCILDDIFDYLHRPGLKTNNKKLACILFCFLWATRSNLHIIPVPWFMTYIQQNSHAKPVQDRIFVYMHVNTHSETAKALWWGTEGLFDSCSG